jgi:acetyl-CoA synthetase
LAASCRAANLFKNLGISKGDRVLFYTRSLPETVYGLLGALLFGAVPCVLAPGRNSEYLKNVIVRTGARALIVEPNSKALIDSLRKQMEDLWHVVVLSRDPQPVKMGAGDFLWNDYFAPASPQFEAVPCAPHHPAFLHYSDVGISGAVVSHQAAFALRNAARTALDLQEGETGLLMAHPGDMHYIPFAILAPLLAGANQILIEDPLRFTDYPSLSSIQVWYSSFHAFEIILRHTPSLADLLQRVRHISVAHPVDHEFIQMTSSSYGSPLHPVWWERALGSIILAEFAGQPLRWGSLGRSIPGIEVAVVRRLGSPLPIGEEGLLAVRLGIAAPFLEYWNDPTLTKSAIRDGWFVTTQRGRLDSDGYFWPAAGR